MKREGLGLLNLSIVIVVVLVLPMVSYGQTQEFFQNYLLPHVEQFTLDNGLRFLLYQRPEVPIFTAIVMVNVGSLDEPQGKAGIAHMFEHMAFKGTTTIGTTDYQQELPVLNQIEEVGANLVKARLTGCDEQTIQALTEQLAKLETEHQAYIKDNEFDAILNDHGARMVNAMTSSDRTSYILTAPKNLLELWARLEADRFINPVFRQFYQERAVVMEERRMGVDNEPEGELWECLQAIAFQNHPYGKPILGWMEDLQNLTIADARKFHTQHYVAANTVIALVGDVTLKELRQVADKYFDQIPYRPKPEPCVAKEPVQRAERMVILEREAAPKITLAWHAPNYPDPDSLALDLAAGILSSGRSSRLYNRLVVRDQSASRVDAYYSSLSRDPSLFIIDIDPLPGQNHTAIIAAVMDELEAIKATPPAAPELQKIRKQETYQFLQSLDRSFLLALHLAFFELQFGGWQNLGAFLAAGETIEPQTISAAIAKYLRADNRNVGLLLPKADAPALEPAAQEEEQQ